MSAADALIGALSDPAHLVRQNAAAALGMLGAPVVGLLLAQVQDAQTRDEQQWFAEALSRLRDPEAVDILAAALNYLEPPARYGAAEALGAIGERSAVGALVQTLASEDAGSRQRAAQALLEIGGEEAIGGLTVLLADPDPRLRELAVRGLGQAGDEAALLSLLSRLDDAEGSVRMAAAAALAGIRAIAAEPVLLTALDTGSAFSQQAIAHALGGCGGEESIERLLALMNEEGDLQTRLTAAQSLARLGDRRGSAMILRTLNAPNRETRRMAAVALGMTGDPRAVDPLVESIRGSAPDPGTAEGRRQRRRMLESIATVGAPMAPALIELLSSSDPGLRGFAADALAQLGEAAVPALVEALEGHPDRDLRVEAARLLGRMGAAEAVEALMAVLRTALIGPYPLVFFTRLPADPTAPVRAAAAAAIGELGTLDGATLLLSSARYDPSAEVSAAAERALARIGTPAAAERLAQPDVGGFVNRALAAGLALLMAAALAGTAVRLWGIPDAAVLAGIAASGALGVSDALEGRRTPIRLALGGGLAGLAAAWLLAAAGQPPWLGTAAAAVLPAAGAIAGWSRSVLAQRLAGLFGGVMLGFIGAGAAALILGTMRP